MKIFIAGPELEPAVNALAKKSQFTRDFANPPMSLKEMRKNAFEHGQVLAATVGKNRKEDLVGFIWCRPMKPKHMPFSTVYYMGVDPEAKRKGVGYALLRRALKGAKEGRIELVCENSNLTASDFYRSMGGVVCGMGHVGKDNRPYTRWRFE